MQTTLPAPRRAKNDLRVTRFFGRIRLRARPQNDIVSGEGGCRPLLSCLQVRTYFSYIYQKVFTKHKKCDIINLRNDLFRSHFEYRKLQAYIFIINKNVCSVSVRLCRYSVIVIERLFRSIRATFFVRGFGCALFILEGKNEQLQVSGI